MTDRIALKKYVVHEDDDHNVGLYDSARSGPLHLWCIRFEHLHDSEVGLAYVLATNEKYAVDQARCNWPEDVYAHVETHQVPLMIQGWGRSCF